MDNIAEKILLVIKKTRDITLPCFGNIKILEHKTEHAHDIVTKIDQETEKYLKGELKKLYPDISFIGEEFGGDREAKKFWLVDPIDGTSLYSRGMPFCTTMLALIENGEVTFAVIYDFVRDIIYHAQKGKGAYKNGVRIHVSDRPVSDSYIGWETHLDKPKNLKIILELHKFSALFKAMCAGYEYAMIAEGKLEGRITFDPWGKDYDFAPGSLLVKEAGGFVTNLGSKNYDYKNFNFIATNLPLYKKLTEGPNALFPITD